MSKIWLAQIRPQLGATGGAFSRLVASYGLMTCVLLSPPIRGTLQLLAWQITEVPTALSALEKQTFTDQALRIVLLGQTQNTVFTRAEVAHFLDVHHVLVGWGIVVSATLVIGLVIEQQLQLNKLFAPDLIVRNLRVLAVFILCATIVIGSFFSTFFEMFHQLLFPAGNYAFPETSIMIQLFPPTFWLLSAVVLQLGVTGLLWWQAQMMLRHFGNKDEEEQQ